VGEVGPRAVPVLPPAGCPQAPSRAGVR